MKRSHKLPKCIRPEEFKKLISIVPKKHIKARIAFLLAYGTGMRISEVLRCSPEHFRKDSIFIPISKNDVERVVPIPKGWKEIYFKHLPLPNPKIKFDSEIRKYERWFKNYCKKAKLNPLYSFHSMRHGFATRLLENGSPINYVQLLLGHSNLSTTSIYTKANPIDAIKSYEDVF